MSDRAAEMTGAKRAINDGKYECVRAVIAQIKDQGRDRGVDRCGETLAEHSIASTAVNDLRAQVEQLTNAQAELRRQLRDSKEELEAARRLNRTLIRERNATTPET